MDRPKRAAARVSYAETPEFYDDESGDFTDEDRGRPSRNSRKRRRERDVHGIGLPRKSRSGRPIRAPSNYRNQEDFSDDDSDYNVRRSHRRAQRPEPHRRERRRNARRSSRESEVAYRDEEVTGDDENESDSDGDGGYSVHDEEDDDMPPLRKSARLSAENEVNPPITTDEGLDELLLDEGNAAKEESCKVRLPLKSSSSLLHEGNGVIDENEMSNTAGGDEEMKDAAAKKAAGDEEDKDSDDQEEVVRRSTRTRRQRLPRLEDEPIESGGDDQEFQVPVEETDVDEEYNAERAELAADELVSQPATTGRYGLRTRSASRRPVEAQKGLRSSARLAKSTRQPRERRHIRKYPVRHRRPAKRYVSRPTSTARDSYRPKRSLRPADLYESSSPSPSSSSDDEHFGPARSPTGALPPNVGDGNLEVSAIDFLKNPMALTDEVGKTRPRSSRYGRRRGRAAKAGLDPFANRAARIASKHPPIEPIKVDPDLSWDDIGGLDHHVRALKEMVFLPLVYPEVFEKFKISPPKGVLFYGPPGTGKTLCARTLAASCGGEPEPKPTSSDAAFQKKSPEDPASKPTSAEKEKEDPPNTQTNTQQLPNGNSGEEPMKPDGYIVAEKGGTLPTSTAPNGSPAAMEIEVNGQPGGNTAETMQKDVVTEQAAAILAAATDKAAEKQSQAPKPSDGAKEKPQQKQRVAFFMRNGADCLSKWVGEAERQLRMTFEAAKRHQPAIIFFDEIDGLAPVRSSRQDQIHSSIVSTLLGLMDGLDGRGQIVVIGATNRVDAIDPALRRPGRFDRELIFTLPNGKARRRIMEIQTQNWKPKPPAPKVLDSIAERTVGYCGADLKALCTEAALRALRRRYPQIYQSLDKLLIDTDNVKVSTRDFLAAMSSIVPAAHRSARTHARPVPERLQAVLKQPFQKCIEIIKRIFPQGVSPEFKNKTLQDDDENLSEDISDDDEDVGEDGDGKLNQSLGNKGREVYGQSSSAFQRPVVRPRLLISGNPGLGQTQLGPAILHYLEGCPVHSIDLPSLHMNSSARSAEEALVSAVREASRSAPSILYLPHLHLWWATATESLKSTLMIALRDLPTDLPLLLLITSEEDVHELTEMLSMEVVALTPSKTDERVEMFEPLVSAAIRAPKMTTKALRRKRRERYKPLPKAPLPPPKAVTKEETLKQSLEDDQYIRTLRMEMRAFVENLLRDRKYKVFHEAVDPAVAADYYEIIKEPMDISKIAAAVDKGSYPTVLAMVRDFDLMVKNAIQYNPAHTEDGAAILRRAHGLVDIVHAWADNLNPVLVENCNRIVAKRIAKLAAAREAEKARKEKEAQELIKAAAAAEKDDLPALVPAPSASPERNTGDAMDVDEEVTVVEKSAAVVGTSPKKNIIPAEAGNSHNKAPSNGIVDGGKASSEEEEEPAVPVAEGKVDLLRHLFQSVSCGVSVDGLERLHVKCATLIYTKRRERDRNQVVADLQALLIRAREDPAIVGNLVE